MNFDITIAYRIAHAVAQHFKVDNIIVGFNARETSPELAGGLARNLRRGVWLEQRECIGRLPNLMPIQVLNYRVAQPDQLHRPLNYKTPFASTG